MHCVQRGFLQQNAKVAHAAAMQMRRSTQSDRGEQLITTSDVPDAPLLTNIKNVGTNLRNRPQFLKPKKKWKPKELMYKRVLRKRSSTPPNHKSRADVPPPPPPRPSQEV